MILPERNGKLLDSVTGAIGWTPLVALDRLTEDLDGRIVAKLEMLNPGFSKKDRAALRIIDEAERRGDIQPGDTVVELTSGNMGTGLAIVCVVRDYRFVAVMSKGNSSERARMMRALGAEVVLVDQLPDSIPGEVSGGDLELVEQETQRIVKERDAFRADQFELLGNRHAHHDGTAAEIWQQSRGAVTAFCDFVGSGGTFAGCASYLREQNRGIRCYVVEPEGAAVLAGESITRPQHPIQGGGYVRPELSQMDESRPDGYLTVTHEEAIEMTRRLARREGIFAGFSSGANVAAAMQLLRGKEAGGTIAVVICDAGLKYLSTTLWP
ncbi:MAG: cysteine synthase family protein [Xanthomonadales bacterium]|nr:cysteine synthase family protein [Xanthomonadales bacterium]